MTTNMNNRLKKGWKPKFFIIYIVVFGCITAVVNGYGQESVSHNVESKVDNANQELKEIRTPDILFVPTPHEVVDRMLELAEVKKDDLIYDLGC